MTHPIIHGPIVARDQATDYTCLILAQMENTNSHEMKAPDYDGALEYAYHRLMGELLPHLHYHNLYHSFGEVLPAALFLAGQIGLVEDDIQLLEVAAAFHDIGWIVKGEDHERIGVEICWQSLPEFGFSETHLHRIGGMIMATRLPQSPQNVLEEILADADMFTLGSDDFWPRNADLRYEKEALGDVVSDEVWYQSQLDFLQIHHYHTAAARNERDLQKKEYIAELLLHTAQNSMIDGLTSIRP